MSYEGMASLVVPRGRLSLRRAQRENRINFKIEERTNMATATGHSVGTTTHEVRRLAVPLGRLYADAICAFEDAIPVLDR